MATSAGAELALLLLNGFHSMTHEVVVELDRRGHPGVRPVHEFALRAVDNGATSASELGRRLAVSKQAAAKTIAALEELGYVERAPDPVDARRKQIRVTARGHELMSIGGALFDDVRERWATKIGRPELDALEQHLNEVVSRRPLVPEDLARDADARAPAQR
jgi:DNA-binding MarR family transcriptional regulator